MNARSELAAGNIAKAGTWLDRAYQECQVSGVVMRRISETYRQMNDEANAKRFAEQADRLENRTPLTFDQQKQPQQTPTQVTAKAPSDVEDNSFVRDKWALIVGVSKFKNPSMNLRFAAKDATDFAAMLSDPNVGRFHNDSQHIKLLTDDNATVQNIRTAIQDIARNARKEDLVVLYFSSHGTDAGMDVATDEGKTGYIVTHETDPNNLYATAFDMQELKRVVDTRIQAGRVVAFMDTCYSGGFRQRTGSKALSVGIPSESVARIAQGKGRVVIASSRDSEQSWESDQYQNSYFTHYIIEAYAQHRGN
ncbi:MAG: caspase family protein [Bryobacteraceae bacterium]